MDWYPKVWWSPSPLLYVFLAIKVILCAHTKDYPNNPPESGEFCSPVSHNLAWAKFVCIGALPHLLFIIQCAIDEFISFCNCRAHQTTLDNVVWLSTLCCTWELQFSPPQITCAHHLQSIYMQQSNTSLQHMSGMLMPSDTVSSRSSSMIHPKRISPFFMIYATRLLPCEYSILIIFKQASLSYP